MKEMITKRRKVFVALPLKKKQKEYYGTCEITYAHIPVLGDVVGMRFGVDSNKPNTYTILPCAQQTKSGKLVYKDDSSSESFKELDLMNLYLFDDLDECIESCRQANSYVLKLFSQDLVDKVKVIQEEEIARATDYIKNQLGAKEEKGL